MIGAVGVHRLSQGKVDNFELDAVPMNELVLNDFFSVSDFALEWVGNGLLLFVIPPLIALTYIIYSRTYPEVRGRWFLGPRLTSRHRIFPNNSPVTRTYFRILASRR